MSEINTNVGLRVTSKDLAITRGVQRRRRILFWRKRWCTEVLASKPWTGKRSDVMRLERYGDLLVATINDQRVLTYRPMPNTMRYKGFGMNAADAFRLLPKSLRHFNTQD